MESLKISAAALLLVITASVTHAQSTGPSWKRSESRSTPALQLFHANHAINLPTATMLRRQTFEFEIAHRFFPTIESGHEVLFGLDGPAAIRFALTYGVSDRLAVTLGRSNLNDNVDLSIKGRVFELASSSLPVLVGVQAGTGWNTEVLGLSDTDSRAFQFYFRAMINTMFAKRLALGLVPAYLYNTNVRSADTEEIITLGVIAQYYVSPLLSLMAEWDPSLGGDDYLHDPVSWGIELETGGHFFKLAVSNSTRLNPSQYIAGSDDPAGGRYWHLGFSITRLLKFW
ncbi:MAG: hypothetical protein JSU74_01335 [Candidatus Zixiibacteriota bacterium]|nr:MAG: hypothetical protein JSU74_01335 [candidate division Zixibacteria bacterium]